MDKAQKELNKTYWRARGIAGESGHQYKDYEIRVVFTDARFTEEKKQILTSGQAIPQRFFSVLFKNNDI